ncbi:MAG: MIP/aquaporin family protein [Pseudomonadota bacterium]
MTRKIVAEALGTLLLLAIVVGSGIMGETLAGGNDAVALLGNTLATGAGLIVLILIFGPVSGAHFNPAVTAIFALRGEISVAGAAAYIAAQIAGALCGVALAHAMFDLDLAQTSLKARDGFGQALGEATATFGLILTILGCARNRPEATPYAVGLFITAGYWFTSSTSFANPAVAIARTFTNTFSGMRPADAPSFIAAEFIGALIALALARYLFPKPQSGA